MKTKIFMVLLIGSLLISACAQATTGAPTPGLPPVSTPTSGVPYPAPTQPTGGAYPPPTQSSGGAYPPPTQPSGSLTPAQSAAIQAASDKYSIPVDQFTVLSTEKVTWPNGCLGVVIPGVMCTDVITDGYRILLEANGQQFEFHTNLDGTSVIDAAQLQATLSFVVYSADGTLQKVSPSIPLGPTYNPSYTGFLPQGGSAAGTAYVFVANQNKVVAIDDSGTRDLTFIQKPTYGLAIWRGGEGASPMLAWGTQLTDDTHPSTLQISAPDGTGLETILTLEAGATPPQALVAEFWSVDGQTLYFSKEPVGIGGYIPFSGGSNLFQIDIATKEVTEIIPISADTGPQTCLDAISGDYRYVADHCTQNTITVRNLQSGEEVKIQPPADITDVGLLGSARFSPDGSLVAFALAKGNPDNEQGWIALDDSKGGAAKTILVGNPGSYYTIFGWLDDQTLLVQLNSLGCATCVNEVYAVRIDESAPTKVAEGTLLVVVDNR